MADLFDYAQPQPAGPGIFDYSEPPDFTDKYNTQLSPEDERAYQAWIKQQSAQQGRDMSKDTFDYDMRGFWKSGGNFADNGHAGDTFKKPNHPTFSSYSKYDGEDGYYGGLWGGGQNGQPWTFRPSATNLNTYGPQGLRDYFQRAEPGNQLIIGQ